MEIWTGSSRRRSKQDFRENRPNYPNYPTVFVPRCALCTVASQSNTPLGAHVDNPIKARFQGESAKLPKLPYRFRFKVRPLHRRITIKHPLQRKVEYHQPRP